VLAGVLLHVVQPARPIDSSSNRRADLRRASLNYMKHAVFFVIDAFDNASAV
jgi:hypothetical protein